MKLAKGIVAARIEVRVSAVFSIALFWVDNFNALTMPQLHPVSPKSCTLDSKVGAFGLNVGFVLVGNKAKLRTPVYYKALTSN